MLFRPDLRIWQVTMFSNSHEVCSFEMYYLRCIYFCMKRLINESDFLYEVSDFFGHLCKIIYNYISLEPRILSAKALSPFVALIPYC